mmetsp:Transcript_4795/g.11694  ORF Transcript_4795/g.11694 Transcript_4795/m.11694 type:complete len:219 (+) Transcript_4795:2365-3021(+)
MSNPTLYAEEDLDNADSGRLPDIDEYPPPKVSPPSSLSLSRKPMLLIRLGPREFPVLPGMEWTTDPIIEPAAELPRNRAFCLFRHCAPSRLASIIVAKLRPPPTRDFLLKRFSQYSAVPILDSSLRWSSATSSVSCGCPRTRLCSLIFAARIICVYSRGSTNFFSLCRTPRKWCRSSAPALVSLRCMNDICTKRLSNSFVVRSSSGLAHNFRWTDCRR